MKVLVGLLVTPEGWAALETAAKWVRDANGELHVVAYVPNPTKEGEAEDYVHVREEREKALDDYVAKQQAAGLTCEGHVVAGASHPSDALLQVASQQRVDLIVIGMRRRSRVGKLVLGSNAQDVLLNADCPVLAVKADST